DYYCSSYVTGSTYMF
nr:immunoglobulin light chain junction region [Macaca mulatta]